MPARPLLRSGLVALAGLALTMGCGPDVAATASAPAARAATDPSVSTPHEDSYYPAIGDPSVDALHYVVDVDWDRAARQLTASTALTFRVPRAEDHVQLDLEKQLTVSSVTLDGAAVAFTHPGKNLVVQTGALARDSRHTLEIAYAGSPQPYAFPGTRDDIPGLGWTVTRSGAVWTMQEPYGAFTWYPSNDQPADKATYDVSVTTESDWHGVANGEMVSDTVADGRRTSEFHLASPAASYLVTVAIGPYKRYTQTGPHGLPLSYWVTPADRKFLPLLKRSPQILAQLEKRLGRYPFATAGAVMVPADSAMETQTMLTMGDTASTAETSFLPELAHEYAHAWYGDTVTPNDWRDLWLNESFTMFNQIRWEVDRGYVTEAQYRAFLLDYDRKYRHRDGAPGAYRKGQFASGEVYYGGARMLFALRDKIGERTFDRLIKAWPREHRYATATRAEWIAFADQFTHRKLDGFIRHWLTAKDAPRG